MKLLLCVLCVLCGCPAFASDRLIRLASPPGNAELMVGMQDWWSFPPRSSIVQLTAPNVQYWKSRLSSHLLINSDTNLEPVLTTTNVYFVPNLRGQWLQCLSPGVGRFPGQTITVAAVAKGYAIGGSMCGFAFQDQSEGIVDVPWYIWLGPTISIRREASAGGSIENCDFNGVLDTNLPLNIIIATFDGTNATLRLNGRTYQSAWATGRTIVDDTGALYAGALPDCCNTAVVSLASSQMGLRELLLCRGMGLADQMHLENILHSIYPSITLTNCPVLGCGYDSNILAGVEVFGPYNSLAFGLTNIGSGSLTWVCRTNLTANDAVLNASPASGTLAAGAGQIVTVTLDPASQAILLNPLVYAASMQFSNTANNVGTTNIAISIRPQPE